MGRDFSSQFAQLAGRVRRRLELRVALLGLAVGALLGCGAALAAWALRAPAARPLIAAGMALVGAVVGTWLARKRAFSDEEVALYLDRRLGSDEVIVTALSFADAATPTSDAARVIVERAARALCEAAPARVNPALFTRAHAALPLALGLAIFGSLIAPRSPLPPPPPATGSDLLHEQSPAELDEAVEALAKAKSKDQAQEERLQVLRSKAAELREKLAEGAPRREIMSELSDLSDAIAREQLALGEGKERQGFEAALEQLKKAELGAARQALAEHDPEKLEQEISRAANKKDAQARKDARQALADAAKAARDADAPGVAEALEAQLSRFDREAQKADKLRALADALQKNLDEDAKSDLDAMNQGDPEAAKRLAEALAKALDGLSPEELAELQKQVAEAAKAEGANGKPQELTAEQKKQLEELMKQLETEAGKKALAEAMKQMAAGEPASDDAARAEKLAAAAAALAQLKQRLAGGPPGAAPGAGPASSSKPLGRTSKLDPPSTPTKASASLNPGMPLPGSSVGRTSSRPGETANRAGTGALGRVGPDEIGGVSQSEVPDEYREQVGRYFQP